MITGAIAEGQSAGPAGHLPVDAPAYLPAVDDRRRRRKLFGYEIGSDPDGSEMGVADHLVSGGADAKMTALVITSHPKPCIGTDPIARLFLPRSASRGSRAFLYLAQPNDPKKKRGLHTRLDAYLYP
jgi:hypothetical protein